MTRRTSSFQGHTRKCIAFRAGTRLPEKKSVEFSAPEPETKHSAKQAQTLRFMPNGANPHHPRTPLEVLASRFPHRVHTDPTASS